MKNVIALIVLAFALTVHSATLSWTPPTNTTYTVRIYKSGNLFTPLSSWPLFFQTNNPAVTSIVVSAFGPPAFFYGNYTVETVTSNSAASITLGWDSYIAPVSTFVLYRGSKPNTYTNSLQIGDVTQYVVATTNLTKSNYFALTAVAPSGLESPESNEAAYIKDIIVTTNVYGLFLNLKR